MTLILAAMFATAFDLKAHLVYDVRIAQRKILPHLSDMDEARFFFLVQGLLTFLLSIINALLMLGTLILITQQAMKRQKIKPTITTQTTHNKKATPITNNWTGNVLATKKNLNISLFTIMLSGTMMSFLVYVAMLDNVRGFESNFKKVILHLFLDTIAIINPFGLLLLSKALRDRIAQVLIPKRHLSQVKREKLENLFSKLLFSVACAFFAYMFVLILALVDIYNYCGPYNFSYDGIPSCQLPMGCLNSKGKHEVT